MQEDNIHPNAAAQPILLDTLWPYLEPLLAPEATPGDPAPPLSLPDCSMSKSSELP